MAVSSKTYRNYSSIMYPLYVELGRGDNGSIFPGTMEGAVFLRKTSISTPGINLDTDFVIRGFGGEYSEYWVNVEVSIRKYSVITRSWGNWESKYTGRIKNSGPSQADLWAARGAYYGFICGGESHTPGEFSSSGKMVKLFANYGSSFNPNYYYDPYANDTWKKFDQMSRSEFERICWYFSGYKKSLNQETYYLNFCLKSWNSSAPGVPGQTVYLFPESFKTRYLSNRGRWNRNSNWIPSTVGSRRYRDFVQPSEPCDGGANESQLANITTVGQAGESHWQLRFSVVNKVGNRRTWYYPADGSLSNINQIDNALLGIPDKQNSSGWADVDWPPRYDAKFSKSNGTTFTELKSAGYRVNQNGDWTVF